MVGLLDYFQPRWDLGLLGLPIGNQNFGEIPPPGLLGGRDYTAPATLNNLPEALGYPFVQGGPGGGTPLRLTVRPTDAALPLTANSATGGSSVLTLPANMAGPDPCSATVSCRHGAATARVQRSRLSARNGATVCPPVILSIDSPKTGAFG